MSIKPYTCKRHGQTTAYVYVVKQGPNKGRTLKKCRVCTSGFVKSEWQKVKMGLVNAYGGKCACCGETEPRFLTLDHINGNGSKHRKSSGLIGWRLYQWLAKQGYPKDEYQLLCYNCNCAKGQSGRCPHQV